MSLLVAAKRPDLVRGLMLADPVLMKKGIYRTYNTPLLNLTIGRNALSKGALRRRREFASPAEAAESLRGRGAFKTWRAPFLDDYVVDGVLRRDDGVFTLACTPEYEVSGVRGAPLSAVGRDHDG